MLICNPFGFGVLSKTATFGWLFNARAASFERNTVHRCARSPNQNHGVWGYGGVILYPNAFGVAKSTGGVRHRR